LEYHLSYLWLVGALEKHQCERETYFCADCIRNKRWAQSYVNY